MSKQHTWPEVVHYYLNSKIKVLEIGTGRIYNLIGLSMDNNGGEYFPKYQTVGVWGHMGYGAWEMKWEDHKPIFRAVDDITDAEAEEFFNLRERKGAWDHAFAKKTHGSYKQWFLHVSNTERMHKSSIDCNLGYTPTELLWLIARGFDVFGLISSGQAIRKEVQNG